MLTRTGLLPTTFDFTVTRSCRCVSARVTPAIWNSQTVRKFNLKKHPQGTEIKAGFLMFRWIKKTKKHILELPSWFLKSIKTVKLNHFLGGKPFRIRDRSCILSGHHNAPDESVDSDNGSYRGRNCATCPFVEANDWKLIEIGDLTPKGWYL